MLNEKTLSELADYIQSHQAMDIQLYSDFSVCESRQEIEIEDFIRLNLKPSFKELLFHYIDRSGASDSEIYTKARIDRKHFSKIRSLSKYRPKKNTVMALVFALELCEEEAEAMLNAAGYSLSGSEVQDLVLQFCLERKIYKIEDVNEALMYVGLQPLID